MSQWTNTHNNNKHSTFVQSTHFKETKMITDKFVFRKRIAILQTKNSFSLAEASKLFKMFNIPNTFALLLCCSHLSFTWTRKIQTHTHTHAHRRAYCNVEATTRNVQTKYLMQTLQYRNIANYSHTTDISTCCSIILW